jgi:hypothetical protein
MARARRTEETVNVKGLDALRRELRKVERDGGSDGISLLKEANYKVALMVATRAQGRASSVGRMQARAAASLRPGRQQARAVITGGSASVPFFFGAEFGSYSNVQRNRKGRSFIGFNQFLPYKQPGSGKVGYFLYPTLKTESRNIIEMYGEELDRIMKQAFPD